MTKINGQKKKNYYQLKFEESKGDSKKLWRTLNEVIGRDKMSKSPSFIESNGEFITKPIERGNYFNNDFISKVEM